MLHTDIPADGDKVAISQERQYAKSERERTAIYATRCRSRASDNCVLYWLSTRLDIQTVNLATASLPTHTCFTILLLFDCKIFSVISGGFVQVRCIASPHTFRTHYCTDTARIPCDRQPTMSLSETDTSDNCLYCCLAVPLSGFGNVRVMPFCHHTTFTTNQLFYNFSSAIQEAVLVHSGILNVADMSATSNLPQCPAARTRHICHADRSARFVRCATVSSCLIYVTIYF